MYTQSIQFENSHGSARVPPVNTYSIFLTLTATIAAKLSYKILPLNGNYPVTGRSPP
jgi:hypothetical protein